MAQDRCPVRNPLGSGTVKVVQDVHGKTLSSQDARGYRDHRISTTRSMQADDRRKPLTVSTGRIAVETNLLASAFETELRLIDVEHSAIGTWPLAFSP